MLQGGTILGLIRVIHAAAAQVQGALPLPQQGAAFSQPALEDAANPVKKPGLPRTSATGNLATRRVLGVSIGFEALSGLGEAPASDSTTQRGGLPFDALPGCAAG